MYNFKEQTGTIPYFDFVGTVVSPFGYGSNELLAPREHTDYDSEHKYLLPPNFLRSLISPEAMQNLHTGFDIVRKKYPQRFANLDVHLRGLFRQTGKRESELLLPWDVLTCITFDGKICYTPVNVSFSHQVMTCEWDTDPERDFAIKREIIEQQIMDVTTYYALPGLEISVFGVSFPKKFANGMTNKILSEYPSSIIDEKEVYERWKATKQEFDLGSTYGDYV